MKFLPKHARYVASEHAEQCAVIEWAKLQRRLYMIDEAQDFSALDLLYAIPNGGHRSKAVAGKLKAGGVKRGVPDLCLPMPIGEFHGLYVEMKRARGGRVDDEQQLWGHRLKCVGYIAVICNGSSEALEIISRYLSPLRMNGIVHTACRMLNSLSGGTKKALDA